MEANEDFVRSRWEHVIVCDGSYRHYAQGTILLNWANHCFYEFANFEAAADFTRQREEEIRQVGEEIALLARYKESREQILNSPYLTGEWAKTGEPLREHVEIFKRILAARQAALADLRRGWKEQSNA